VRARRNSRARTACLALALACTICREAFAEPAASGSWAPPGMEGESKSSMDRSAAALQLSAAIGPTWTFGDAANPQYQRSTTHVGVLALASIGYRSPYILDPSLDVGYGWLAHGAADLPAGLWGQGGHLHQRLSEWIISPAVSADLWRFRPRLGIGLSIVSQSNELAGVRHTASQISVLSQFGLSFAVLETSVLRLDAEARLALARGTDVTFTTIALSASFDVVRFQH
jgi:hypothetical protein